MQLPAVLYSVHVSGQKRKGAEKDIDVEGRGIKHEGWSKQARCSKLIKVDGWC